MQRYTPALLLLVIGLSAAAPGAAQTPAIQIEEVDCLPNLNNGVIRATVQPEIAGAEVRLYFRWDDHGPYYFEAMVAAGGGTYWATPPKPIDANHQVDAYVAVVDPAGEVVGSPSERVLVPVTDDCDVVLSEHERGMAENLVVGEIEEEQHGEEVLGFLCDGIISRISHDGVLRADSICRRCIFAWWDKPEALLPAALLLGNRSKQPPEPVEASPSRP
ncbi:MAG TPA: hypothetical protein VM599_09060 [Thermoanaerobaculia bacterium]|nr:hypothetical protein [Thermoanaerobaculia bacterium]